MHLVTDLTVLIYVLMFTYLSSAGLAFLDAVSTAVFWGFVLALKNKITIEGSEPVSFDDGIPSRATYLACCAFAFRRNYYQYSS